MKMFHGMLACSKFYYMVFRLIGNIIVPMFPIRRKSKTLKFVIRRNNIYIYVQGDTKLGIIEYLREYFPETYAENQRRKSMTKISKKVNKWVTNYQQRGFHRSRNSHQARPETEPIKNLSFTRDEQAALGGLYVQHER